MQFILHIGAPKTGTSAIQTFMSRNREALNSTFGVFYPSYTYDKAAQRGQATTGNAGTLAKLVVKRPPEDPSDWVRECVQGVSPDATVVLSSELLWSIELKSLQALRDAFKPYGDLKVLFYTGGQVRQLASGYWQMVKNNGGRTLFLEYVSTRGVAFEYFRRLKMMQRVLGEGNVILRPYDRDRFPARNIVLDFLAQVGISPDRAGVLDHSVVNVNQTADASLYMLSLLNNRAGGVIEWLKDAQADDALFASAAISAARRPETLLSNDDLKAVAESFEVENRRLMKFMGDGAPDMNQENSKFIAEHAAAQAAMATTSPMEMLLIESIVQLQMQVSELRAQLNSAA